MASEILDIEEIEDAEQRLVLQSQGLSSVSAEILASAPGTEYLDITDNQLTSGSNLDRFPNLRTLVLDKNGLDQFPPDFPVIPQLETLWINNNRFAHLNSLIDQLERLFPNLAYLSLLRNPACPDIYFSDSAAADVHRRYRLAVIYRLPKLVSLDATQVSDEERKEAERTGRFLQSAARPADPSQYEQGNAQPVAVEPALRSSPIPERRTAPVSYLGSLLSLIFFLSVERRDILLHSIVIKWFALISCSSFDWFLTSGKGRTKYDGRHSEGNRFILNEDLWASSLIFVLVWISFS